MGWCSGTDVFDTMANFVLNSDASGDAKYEVLLALADVLEDHDWDCQGESGHRGDPIVQRVFKKLHPDWDED